jgi:hypothetical protein
LNIDISDSDFISYLYFREGQQALVWSLLAVLFSLILHLAVFAFLPDQVLQRSAKVEADPSPPLLLELEKLQPDEMHFVEANPEAPDNLPDKSNNYSYRNQQAAESNPQLSDQSDKPFVDGIEQSQKILEGQLPQESIEVTPLQTKLNESVSKKRIATTTVLPIGMDRPEFLTPKINGELDDSGSGVLGNKAKIAAGSINGQLQIYEPTQDSKIVESSSDVVLSDAMPRPRLDPKLLVGPLMQSEGAATRRGKIAIDSTFSEFGEYQQQFFAPVLRGWYQEIDFYQPIDVSARVLVSLTLHSNGEVTSVKALQTTATEIATIICENAIAKRSPFRPWTKEMVEVFGNKKTLTVLFIYQ